MHRLIRRNLHGLSLRATGVTWIGLVLGIAAAAQAPPPAKPQNVVFIGVDTLRADHLGCYGYGKPTSPAIDGIARDGTVFAEAMAQRGLTMPSLASIMTSLYPVTHGVRGNAYRLAPEHTCLAEILKAHGFTCGAFLANELTWEQTWKGFDVIGKGTDDQITPRAIDWLTKNRDKPFFLWLFYYAPHKPYLPPVRFGQRFDPAYDGTLTEAQQDRDLEDITLNRTKLSETDLDKVLALYDGEIAYTDDQIRQVIEALRALGLDDRSLIVVFADHGEELYDHDCYFYHITSIHGSVLHVPLVFRLPGTVPGNLRVPGVVELIDLAPTVLNLLGIPASPAFQGRSLRPLFTNPSADLGPAFSENKDQILTIRTTQYRFIHNPLKFKLLWIRDEYLRSRTGNRFIEYDTEELYDVTADPKESANIAKGHPDVVESLKRSLQEWRRKYRWKFAAAPKAVMDPEQEERLKAQGYLDDGVPSKRGKQP
jgi:arylsulfatase A-like enzyme